jgi:hypothetical protein
MCTGKLEAKFHQVVLQKIGDKPVEDFTSCCFKDKHTSNVGKKGVATAKDDFALNKTKLVGRDIIYEYGPLSATITLHYCTAPGLSANRVFNHPPAASALKRTTLEGKKRCATKKIKREPTENKTAAQSNLVVSTMKKMEQLDSINKQIAGLEADNDLMTN